MSDPVNVLRLGVGGMVSAADSAFLEDVYFTKGINVAIVNGRIGTRPAIRSLILDTDEQGFDKNFQGACFFNPAKGQSGITFSESSSSLMCSIAGVKFRITPRPDGTALVENVNNGLTGNEAAHLSYFYQAEVYAIAQDGLGPTWIFDASTDEARISKGYNATDDGKELSELANGATVGGYVHGRIFQVTNSRQILFGDIIHKGGVGDPSSILQTTEQVYWATGKEFLPPSSMGNVLCGAILCLQDTRHGHGDLMVHCEDGVFSIDASQYPRTKWADLPLTKHVLLDSGARGPYALTLINGDQVYRSRQGIQTLRSAAATAQQLGNPNRPVSDAIGDLLRGDKEELLKFASVSKLSREDRIFTTIRHELSGKYRYAKGVVSWNLSPVDGRGQSAPAWEGIWTTAAEHGYIIQMVSGIFDGTERCYAFTRSEGGKKDGNNIVELNAVGTKDMLPDGSYRKIESKVYTRSIVSTRDQLSRFDVSSGVMFLRNIIGETQIRVSYLTDNEQWTVCYEGTAGVDVGCMAQPRPVDFNPSLNLSSIRCRRIQFKIEWTGYLEIEAVRVYIIPGDGSHGADEESPYLEQIPCLQEDDDYLYSSHACQQ